MLLRIIRKVHGKTIDIGGVPLDDKKTFKLLCRGDTTGVFQLESSGMKRYLKELEPTVFDDITAMVALYRPGPIQFLDDFIACKHGRKAITYLHPKMESALKSTYGVLVYQEQFMQISKDLAGFSGGQADTLRKAVGKKIIELMKKVKPEFIEGAINHSGADRELMEKFWAQLEKFADYCFNKSHAACYALIAYWTAYLKAHYPAAFMAALMTSDYDDTDRLAIEISECRRMGIKVLPPDINQSFHEFAVVPHEDSNKTEIRFGMDAIKNVGQGAVAEIIKDRDTNGPYQSISDFVSRVDSHLVNRKTWESLVKTGAFDRFENRGALLEGLDSVLAAASKIHKDKQNGQTDLFTSNGLESVSAIAVSIPKVAKQFAEHEYLQWERELLGLYLSQHPLESYDSLLAEQSVPLAQITSEADGRLVTVGGMIGAVRQISTKNGQPMAFIKLEDSVGDERELVVFPNVFKDSQDVWQLQKVVIAKGRVNATDKNGNSNGDPKILVESAKIVTLDEAKNYVSTGKKAAVSSPKNHPKISQPKMDNPPENSLTKRLYLRLTDTTDQALMQELKVLIDDSPGSSDAVLVLGPDKQIIKLPTKITASDELIENLKKLLGDDKVKFQ